jgi:hypothetical protein
MMNDFNKHNLFNPWLTDHYKQIYMPMGLTVGSSPTKGLAPGAGRGRARLAAADGGVPEGGKDAEEIAPMTVTMGDRRRRRRSRRSRSRSRRRVQPSNDGRGLAKLPGAFNPQGSTAGNSSQFSDGASATPSARRPSARRRSGIKPLGFAAPCFRLRG